MTAYFSVDVETTGLNPFVRSNRLASVGAVAFDETGLILDTWYEPLRFTNSWDEDTLRWWEQQNPIARQHMGIGDDTAVVISRTAPGEAARLFVEWVQQWDEHCVFVANPATFDHAWVLRWLTEQKWDMPFDYRTLCLRSADWALDLAGRPWDSERNGTRPQIPHHALHDAQAQGIDMLGLFERRRQFIRNWPNQAESRA